MNAEKSATLENNSPLVDITQRLGTQGTLLGYTPDYTFITETLSNKVNLPAGILPIYLSMMPSYL